MSRRAYLRVSAAIVSLVALLHLARVVFGWSAVIGGWSVPMWLSWVALIVAGALAYFGFSLARQPARKSSFS
jgi:phosphoglycerol transferase MdoB-like AlkP superfamily enzyme